jgi:hypothetical protein
VRTEDLVATVGSVLLDRCLMSLQNGRLIDHTEIEAFLFGTPEIKCWRN